MIGVDLAYRFCDHALNVEAKGGMMTTSGHRRRTPGGVFFHLIKQDNSTISNDMKRKLFNEDGSVRSKKNRKAKKMKKKERAKSEYDDVFIH